MPTLTLSRPGTRLVRSPSVAPVAERQLMAEVIAPVQRSDASSLDSAALLRGGKAVEIMHNGFVYRLQATRLGKLILTK